MIADRISTRDIRNMGIGGVLEVTFPDYKAVCSAKVLVSRCNYFYPEDNKRWRTSFDRKTNKLTVYCERKEES